MSASENGHTGGDWRRSGTRSGLVIVDDRGGTIAAAHRRPWYAKPGEAEANARLIAAAPDGYELAKEFLAFARSGNQFFYPPGSLQKLEQFVAKAEGGAS